MTRVGQDQLNAWQVGGSYRLSTKIRFFGACYSYRFRNEGGDIEADRFNGRVFMVGTRVTL